MKFSKAGPMIFLKGISWKPQQWFKATCSGRVGSGRARVAHGRCRRSCHHATEV